MGTGELNNDGKRKIKRNSSMRHTNKRNQPLWQGKSDS